MSDTIVLRAMHRRGKGPVLHQRRSDVASTGFAGSRSKTKTSPFSLAFESAGKSRLLRIAMRAITTSNSIKVKARRQAPRRERKSQRPETHFRKVFFIIQVSNERWLMP